MKLELLISCMNQRDLSLVTKDKLHCDILLINQCDVNDYIEQEIDGWRVRMISTTQRGLSKSRNMAISHAKGDVCLICDDDEVFYPDFVNMILSEYGKNPALDVGIFALDYSYKKCLVQSKKVNYMDAMRVSSHQISFRRKSLRGKSVSFNEKMGSGTGNGCGEEVRFMFDCLRSKLNIIYFPHVIASLQKDSASQWFHGYTKKYFIDRGWSNKMILGIPLACLYDMFFSIAHHSLYKKDFGFWHAIYYQLLGTFQKR